MTIILILLITLINLSNSLKFLTKNNWIILRNYIKSPETTESMREKVNLILFHRHLPKVDKKIDDFKRFHFKKCLHIDKNDFKVCAYKSFYDCIKKYNGDFTFYYYSDIYIMGSLYKVMTEQYPISKIAKYNRKKSIFKRDEQITFEPNVYLGNNDYISSNLNKNDDSYKNIWFKIDEFEPFVRKIFYYKFDFKLNKIRSNYHISQLMCCSEENVRRILKEKILFLSK